MNSSLRQLIQKRAAGCCEYCQMQEEFSHDPFSAEHIFPIVKGGLDDFENLGWACLGCNLYKFTTTHVVDLITGDLVPLYNPRKEEWTNHFRWSENFTLIEGISSIGRVTVTRLRLNRVGLVNLRQVLVSIGKHPPLF